MVISFDCVKGGVTYKELKKEELEISSDNLNFYPADVRVEDCSIYVSSSEVQNPMYVRHAWSDVASGAIFNSLNIPISTFHLSAKQIYFK